MKTKSRRGDTIFGIPSGWLGLIGVQFGVVINAESFMGWKGLRLLLNSVGVTPMSLGCTPVHPGWSCDEGCYYTQEQPEF